MLNLQSNGLINKMMIENEGEGKLVFSFMIVEISRLKLQKKK